MGIYKNADKGFIIRLIRIHHFDKDHEIEDHGISEKSTCPLKVVVYVEFSSSFSDFILRIPLILTS